MEDNLSQNEEDELANEIDDLDLDG